MENRDRTSENYYKNSIVPGIKLIIAIAQQVKQTTFDYALGAAILGVVPLYGRWIPLIRAICLILLNLQLARNIARFWGYHRGQRWGEKIGCALGIISSLILGFIAWLGILLLGIWIPFLDILARAIAYGVLTFNIGRTVSYYYYSPQSLDLKALTRALKFHRSSS